MATETSILAYYADGQQARFARKRDEIAAHIITRTKAGKRSWIAQIARDLGIDKSAASARLNEIKHDKDLTIDGKRYSLVQVGFIYDTKTKKTVQAFTLRLLIA